jgi:hypothetical protein
VRVDPDLRRVLLRRQPTVLPALHPLCPRLARLPIHPGLQAEELRDGETVVRNAIRRTDTIRTLVPALGRRDGCRTEMGVTYRDSHPVVSQKSIARDLRAPRLVTSTQAAVVRGCSLRRRAPR